MASAADCPGIFDCIIDGQGYVFADPQDVKAEFGLTPTFVTRQNVQGDYGDNQQDFWLTATQHYWSLGEQQRYFRGNDDDAKRRYWVGSAVDVASTPGQVAMRAATIAKTAAANVAVSSPGRIQAGWGNPIAYCTSTNLYEVASDGTITDKGAHGLGATPTAMCSDGFNIYISTTTAGTVGVRKWNGAAFSTFSATGADELAVLNNALYGYRNTTVTGDLIRYDTAGAVTSLFPWKTADGYAQYVETTLKAFGGDLLILRHHDGSDRGSELWLYNGTAPAKIADFGVDFYAWDLEVLAGTVFIGGANARGDGAGGLALQPAIYYYAGGSIGLLWKATNFVVGYAYAYAALATYDGKLVFYDADPDKIMSYDPATGGISSLAAGTFTGNGKHLVAQAGFFGLFRDLSTSFLIYPASTTVTSSTFTTSLFDFDSSLTKRFHAIRIDFDAASDGNGGTVDVAYRLNDVDGSYTSLATGVTSGTEIALTNISGRSISVKVTLNKGTSTSGPVLKRIAIRASPIQPQFPRATYVLNCTGTDREPSSYLTLRDGNKHSKSGLQMVADLKTAAAKTNPITIYDPVNGTFSGVIEADSLKIQSVRRASEFTVQITARGV